MSETRMVREIGADTEPKDANERVHCNVFELVLVLITTIEL